MKIWTKQERRACVEEERRKKSNMQSGSLAPKEMNENIRLTFFFSSSVLLLCCAVMIFSSIFFLFDVNREQSLLVFLTSPNSIGKRIIATTNDTNINFFLHLFFLCKPKTIVLTLEYSPWTTRCHTEARQCYTRFCGLFVATILFAAIFLSFFMSSLSFVRSLAPWRWLKLFLFLLLLKLLKNDIHTHKRLSDNPMI